MTLAEAFEISGLVVSIIAILGVGVKLLGVIADLRVAIATITTELTEIKRRLSQIEAHYAAPGAS